MQLQDIVIGWYLSMYLFKKCISISCMYILEFRFYGQIQNRHVITQKNNLTFFFWNYLYAILNLSPYFDFGQIFSLKIPPLMYKKDLRSRDKNIIRLNWVARLKEKIIIKGFASIILDWYISIHPSMFLSLKRSICNKIC